MTVDKTALKKMIDAARPNDLMVAIVSALDKDSQKKAKVELEKFIGKSDDYVLIAVKR
jgi:hypothetical protein